MEVVYQIRHKIPDNWSCVSVHLYAYDVSGRIYHTVVLDDPYDDPPALETHIPDQSPQLTREQLDVSDFYHHSLHLSLSLSLSAFETCFYFIIVLLILYKCRIKLKLEMHDKASVPPSEYL